MSLEKAKIGDAIYDVISTQEFERDPDSFGQYVAIKGGDGYLYPMRSRTDNRPGCYYCGGMYFFKPPTFDEGHVYDSQNIINFNDASNLRDVIKCQQKLMNAERSILTTIDNVFAPEIDENDTPEMKIMKQAIRDKHIDLDKYESRFGPNYNNDKRLLKKGNITFGKLRDISTALDMKVTLTIEDASPDVPNPIGSVLSTEITGSGMCIDDDGVEGDD